MLSYRLPDDVARNRALAGVALGVFRAIAPIVLAVVLLRRLGWATPGGGPLAWAFWAVVGALVTLVVVRAVVGYGSSRRRLASLVVAVSDEAVGVRTVRDDYAIERGRVARMLEIDGPLGGIVVESRPDPRNGVVLVAKVPRGGEGYAAVRERLEAWGPFERRGRRGPAARVLVFGLVVASIFFVPFFLDDFVVHSRLLGAMVVAGFLLVLRSAMRG